MTKDYLRYAVTAFGVALMAAPAWLILARITYVIPSSPPPIPGATAEEQGGPIVVRGFALGKQYRATILSSHSDSWLAAARDFESGSSWADVRSRWAAPGRIWRDDPFDRMIGPEIDRLLGPRRPATDPDRRRATALFVRSFAAGLKVGGR